MRIKPAKKQMDTNRSSMPKPAANTTGSLAAASGSMNNTSARPTMTPEQWNEAVQKKAYELFEQRGYTQGNDLDDWFEAEKLVKQSMRSAH
jgi:hypothetical protein